MTANKLGQSVLTVHQYPKEGVLCSCLRLFDTTVGAAR